MMSITAVVAGLLAVTRVAAVTTGSSATTTAIGVEQPSTAPVNGAQTVQGCFSSSGDLIFNATLTFNTIGSCAHDTCKPLGKAVAGTTGGSDCWCGDKYPPKNTLANDTDCNIGCTGFNPQACGGNGFWTIYNTGLKLAVDYSGGDTVSSSATSSSTTTAPTVVTMSTGGTTVIVTATSAPETQATSSSNSGGGTNMAGIAAGVVCGIVGVGAIIGGIFFFLRRRRNQEIEEEHRRNAAVSAFINGSKPPGSSGGMSIADSRLDPVMATRRMSSGSIADNQDYSRRILRVTNA